MTCKIIIPIETKVRELDVKLKLAEYIVSNSKFEVILGKQSVINSPHVNFKDCIYFDKSISSAKTALIKKLSKYNKYISTDEEGPYSLLDDFARSIRVPSKIHDLTIEYYLAYGEKDLNLLKDKYEKSQMISLGHPKFDFENKDIIMIYQKEIEKIKRIYGEFIFIPSSFGTYSIRDQDVQDKNFELQYIKNSNYKKKLFKEYKKKREMSNDNFKNFIDFVKLLSKKSKKKIVFRPHPFQDKRKIESLFSSYPNIIVNYDYNITPWIMACDIYIHGGCSSVFEAISMNKKKIVFYLKKLIFRKHRLFKDISHHFDNTNECVDFIIADDFSTKQNLLLEKYITNIFKKDFNAKFINLINNYDYLKSKFEKNSPIKKISIRLILYFKKLISIIFNYDHYLTTKKYFNKSYQSQKISSLKLNDIIKTLNRLNPNTKVHVKKIHEGIFSLS